MLRGNGRRWSGEISRFVVRIISLRYAVAAAVHHDYRGRQVEQMRRQVSRVDLPLICCIGLAQKRARLALAPVILKFLLYVAEDRQAGAQARVWIFMHLLDLAAGVNRGE